MKGWLISVLALLSGCHLGHPVAAVRYSPGPITAAASEPGLDASLRRSLIAALARRGALGEGSAVAVDVLAAESRLVAASGDGAVVYEARLSLSLRLAGPAPRQLVLTGQRSYAATGPLEASLARAAAFEDLTTELMSDAADWLLLSGEP